MAYICIFMAPFITLGSHFSKWAKKGPKWANRSPTWAKRGPERTKRDTANQQGRAPNRVMIKDWHKYSVCNCAVPFLAYLQGLSSPLYRGPFLSNCRALHCPLCKNCELKNEKSVLNMNISSQ